MGAARVDFFSSVCPSAFYVSPAQSVSNCTSSFSASASGSSLYRPRGWGVVGGQRRRGGTRRGRRAVRREIKQYLQRVPTTERHETKRRDGPLDGLLDFLLANDLVQVVLRVAAHGEGSRQSSSWRSTMDQSTALSYLAHLVDGRVVNESDKACNGDGHECILGANVRTRIRLRGGVAQEATSGDAQGGHRSYSREHLDFPFFVLDRANVL